MLYLNLSAQVEMGARWHWGSLGLVAGALPAMLVLRTAVTVLAALVAVASLGLKDSGTLPAMLVLGMARALLMLTGTVGWSAEELKTQAFVAALVSCNTCQ